MSLYTLFHIIENAARQCPNKVAFKYLSETITFLELDVKSNQLAMCLIKKGVKKGDRVGVYMARCLETTIAVYGVLKAGGVYVPLDPFLPILRTEFVIKDCGIKHVISNPQQFRKLKSLSNNLNAFSVVGISKELPYGTTVSWDAVFNLNLEEYKAVSVLGDDLAYILYTSGSTGTPKGIMHTHNSGLAFVTLVSDLYEMQDAIYGMHAPLHFDPSIQGYFAAPYALATTVIVSDAHTKMPASLADLIEKEKITIWYSVPLALIQMLTSGVLLSKNMSSLKWVLFSGEVFPTKYLRQLMNLWDFAKFSNIYGPTETNQCTYYHVTNLPDDSQTIPIGATWGNTDFKIITPKDTEVSFGDQGELVVRTATLMKGYWNNPELTTNSLYKVSNVKGVEQLFYRTGDQVKQDEKGRLLFIGRNDNQIKIRGYRIELGEIETILVTHPVVKEVATFVVNTKSTEEKELVAAILPVENTIVDVGKLKSFCQKKLPAYAIPDKVFTLKDFPRTASGKVNRKQIENSITKQ